MCLVKCGVWEVNSIVPCMRGVRNPLSCILLGSSPPPLIEQAAVIAEPQDSNDRTPVLHSCTGKGSGDAKNARDAKIEVCTVLIADLILLSSVLQPLQLGHVPVQCQ